MEKMLLYWQDLKTLELLLNSIQKNRVSITATDTILGFIANLSEKGFSQLNNLKGERKDKPYLILISGLHKLNHFVDVSLLDQNAYNLLKNCWPGPVTIVFKSKENLPNFLQSKDGTIAIRYPNHKYLHKLLESFDGLFSTSANKSTSPTPKNLEEIEPDILENVEYVVTDKIEKDNLIIDTNVHLYQTLPSSIIDLSSRNEVKIIRQGAYPIGELEKFYGSKFKKSE